MTEGESRVAALVLAAGRSRRFGGDKRLARLPEGEALLARTLRVADEAFGAVFLVLREDDPPDLLADQAPHGIRVPAPGAAGGLGCSIADGMRALVRSEWAAGGTAVAVLLGDMPWIAVDTCRRLAARADPARILRPVHCGGHRHGQRAEPGHPVLFGRDFWPELCRLEGEEGARGMLRRHADAVSLVMVDDPGVVRDVDRPGDLARPVAPPAQGR